MTIRVVQEHPLAIDVSIGHETHRIAVFDSLTSNGRSFTPRCSCGWRGQPQHDPSRAELAVRRHADLLSPDHNRLLSGGEPPKTGEEPQPPKTGQMDVVRMVIASATDSRRRLAIAKSALLQAERLNPEQEAALIIEQARLAAQSEFGDEILAIIDKLAGP